MTEGRRTAAAAKIWRAAASCAASNARTVAPSCAPTAAYVGHQCATSAAHRRPASITARQACDIRPAITRPACDGIQLAMGPQPLWLRNHNFGLAQRIIVKRLATSPHDPLGITDSACKNKLVVVSVQYGPFNTYIPIRSTTIGKSGVAKDPIAMHTSWRSNSDIASIPNKFCSVFQQGIDTNSFVGYFSDSGVQPVLQSVPEIELLSSDGSRVYRSRSSQSDTIFDQDDLMDFHANSDSDEQSSDHQFELPVRTNNVGSTPAVAQFYLPAIDIKESFAQLRASIEDIRFEKIRRKDDTDRLRDVLLMHITDLEKNLTERFDLQDRAYRTLLTNSRKDIQDLRTSCHSQKKPSTQVAAAALDNVDGRKEVKELHAKVTYLDGQVAAIRNDLLNFHAKAEENHLNLSTQLGFLIDYINRGGDSKKGESGSSQPRPPHDDQSRPSGGSGDSGSQRSSGSSKGRRSSGESPVRGIRYGPYPPGAPPKRSAKY
ncbi:hypothetical protein F511_44455 [Dorcoceras hygrometricum]|uniref:Uncharacterized protein n=1 Tax=Dorcoceras hygrometricum TaxID=472368 RepID=A0A2Z7A9Z8_9LAMI|nr:hypothetical protein F511_44455 [Dorcoceras hygrometricum]